MQGCQFLRKRMLEELFVHIVWLLLWHCIPSNILSYVNCLNWWRCVSVHNSQSMHSVVYNVSTICIVHIVRWLHTQWHRPWSLHAVQFWLCQHELVRCVASMIDYQHLVTAWDSVQSVLCTLSDDSIHSDTDLEVCIQSSFDYASMSTLCCQYDRLPTLSYCMGFSTICIVHIVRWLHTQWHRPSSLHTVQFWLCQHELVCCVASMIDYQHLVTAWDSITVIIILLSCLWTPSIVGLDS